MKTIAELYEKANGWSPAEFDRTVEELERFAALVRADERDRNTQLLYKMHERAFGMHNYYKHAAVEINRKDGEGEKI